MRKMPTGKLMPALACLSMAACAAVADVGDDKMMTDNKIGPAQLEMTIKDIESLGAPFTREEISLEGDLYPRYRLRIGDDAEVTVTVDAAGKAFEITTASSRFVTKDGARVGMTLSELQTRFPHGKVNRGYADGLYFVFVTRDGGGVFAFDVNAIGKDCILRERKCAADLGGQKSSSYFVRKA
jgi:hypothetical protein